MRSISNPNFHNIIFIPFSNNACFFHNKKNPISYRELIPQNAKNNNKKILNQTENEHLIKHNFTIKYEKRKETCDVICSHKYFRNIVSKEIVTFANLQTHTFLVRSQLYCFFCYPLLMKRTEKFVRNYFSSHTIRIGLFDFSFGACFAASKRKVFCFSF